MHRTPSGRIKSLRVLWGIAALVAAAVAVWAAGPANAHAQWGDFQPSGPIDLADTVQLDLAESTTLALLERARANLAKQQWEEAIQTLRQVSETAPEKLIALNDWRYVGLRDYCQMQRSIPWPRSGIAAAWLNATRRGWQRWWTRPWPAVGATMH